MTSEFCKKGRFFFTEMDEFKYSRSWIDSKGSKSHRISKDCRYEKIKYSLFLLFITKNMYEVHLKWIYYNLVQLYYTDPPPVPPLPGPGLAIHHVVSLSQGLSDLTIPWGDPRHLGEVVRPKLDYSIKGKGILMNDAVWNSSKSKQILPDFWMNTTTDKILQHLPFTALAFIWGCLI